MPAPNRNYEFKKNTHLFIAFSFVWLVNVKLVARKTSEFFSYNIHFVAHCAAPCSVPPEQRHHSHPPSYVPDPAPSSNALKSIVPSKHINVCYVLKNVTKDVLRSQIYSSITC